MIIKHLIKKRNEKKMKKEKIKVYNIIISTIVLIAVLASRVISTSFSQPSITPYILQSENNGNIQSANDFAQNGSTYTPNNNFYINPYIMPNQNFYLTPGNSTYYYPNYNIGNTNYIVPADSFYYIAGYNPPSYGLSYGEPMVSRVPVLGGNYSYPTYKANNLVYNAYRSISDWCNSNILHKGNVQDYFLNSAIIESETPYEIIMTVNCALYKNSAINGHIEFRVTINVASDRFKWRKVNSTGTNDDIRVYEFDSDTGELIIIR